MSRIMATGTSMMFLPVPFNGFNESESYIPDFTCLSHLGKQKRTELRERNEVTIDDRPKYFSLRFQKSAMDFYCT